MTAREAEIMAGVGGDVLKLAAEKAQEYVRGVATRRVSPAVKDVAALARLQESFPEQSSDAAEVIELLHEVGSPATVASTGGRYFGFVIGGALAASMAASWMAGAWDQNVALRVMSPIAAEVEDVVLAWVLQALGLPPECEGGLVTCATTANFT